LPKIIPDYGNKAKKIEGQLNILVAGSHGGLVDTMILANINPASRRITLTSLPRDLYYNNRKINSIYGLYGMEELKRTIAFVTGFEVDKYILIDMYAFIDVIDLIGGIDVHLDEAVIDPTYKTFDGGEWGTLYYRAGDHHLSGRQALRLARTRHTSSDFARSERQHLILAAIQAKAQSFGLGDASGLKILAKQVLDKTKTDISLAEAIAYYFRYQSFEINGGNVLSTENVLDSKFANDEGYAVAGCPASKKATEDQKKKCAEYDRGAYILVPKNDDWNTVKWYYRKIIKFDTL
jgi:polyisoprenyl-teichoic acid--peptidoglycan teichoic acid transferase